MKYLKSFLLLSLLMMIPVIAVALLSVFVSIWFLFGEIIALLIIILAVVKLAVSNKID